MFTDLLAQPFIMAYTRAYNEQYHNSCDKCMIADAQGPNTPIKSPTGSNPCTLCNSAAVLCCELGHSAPTTAQTSPCDANINVTDSRFSNPTESKLVFLYHEETVSPK